MTQANTSSTPTQAIDSHLIPITFFDDKFAAVKYEDSLTLPDLADEILRMTDRAKKKLPWLKLAKFGDIRTANNSLRSNDNVRAPEPTPASSTRAAATSSRWTATTRTIPPTSPA